MLFCCFLLLSSFAPGAAAAYAEDADADRMQVTFRNELPEPVTIFSAKSVVFLRVTTQFLRSVGKEL